MGKFQKQMKPTSKENLIKAGLLSIQSGFLVSLKGELALKELSSFQQKSGILLLLSLSLRVLYPKTAHCSVQMNGEPIINLERQVIIIKQCAIKQTLLQIKSSRLKNPLKIYLKEITYLNRGILCIPKALREVEVSQVKALSLQR